MGTSRKLSFHHAQWHLLILCKNMYVLEILAVSPNALPLFFSDLLLIQPGKAHKKPDSPHPLIPASQNVCKKREPTFICHCYYASCAVHNFPISVTEINECRALCEVLWEDSKTDPALQELSVRERTGITAQADFSGMFSLPFSKNYTVHVPVCQAPGQMQFLPPVVLTPSLCRKWALFIFVEPLLKLQT